MTAEVLARTLDEMQKDTQAGKIKWQLEVQTTEYNDKSTKPVAEVDDEKWVVDECYTSFYCKFREMEFCMITYENIETAGEKVRTTNLIFIPPIAIRIFDIDQLAPYAIQTSAVLVAQIRKLWELLLNMYKEDPMSVEMNVNEVNLIEKE